MDLRDINYSFHFNGRHIKRLHIGHYLVSGWWRSDLDRMLGMKISWPVGAPIKMSMAHNWQPINLSTATVSRGAHVVTSQILMVASASPGPPRYVPDCKTANPVYLSRSITLYWLLKISCLVLFSYQSTLLIFEGNIFFGGGDGNNKKKTRQYLKTLQNT